MVTFCIIHIGNRKTVLKYHPQSQLTNPFARKCVLIFYIIYVKTSWDSMCVCGGGGGLYPTAQNVTSERARTLAIGFLVCSLENLFSSIMK